MNIAIFCSGNGTNLQAIIDAHRRGEIRGDLRLVVSDVRDCFALTRAKKSGIQTFIVERKDFKSKREFEDRILGKLKEEKIELVVLAGYMRLLSPYFVGAYKNRILNIHPALLPAFKGTDGVRDAFLYGVKVTGPTVHFVTEDMDAGPIILQSAILVKENDTEEGLRDAIQREEHNIYPRAIQLVIEGRLRLEGRRVRIL